MSGAVLPRKEMEAEAAFSKDKHVVTSSPCPEEDGTSTGNITNYIQKTNSLTRLL